MAPVHGSPSWRTPRFPFIFHPTNLLKWYTCTPVSFKGDHTFFSRDSGAFCKAFQRIGVESRAIMPTPAQEGDEPDLIRTEYANLEDPALSLIHISQRTRLRDIAVRTKSI